MLTSDRDTAHPRVPSSAPGARPMMPDRRNDDRHSYAALAATATLFAVRDIQKSQAQDREALLSALLSAAWPSREAQNQ